MELQEFKLSWMKMARLMGAFVLLVLMGVVIVLSPEIYPFEKRVMALPVTFGLGLVCLYALTRVFRMPSVRYRIFDNGIAIYPTRKEKFIHWNDVESVSEHQGQVDWDVRLKFTQKAAANRSKWEGKYFEDLNAIPLKASHEELYRAVRNAHAAFQASQKNRNLDKQGDSRNGSPRK
ncbi:MAG: hypothetical protein CSA74_11340 [Rhodobacterales bacterium]|nr:MAG: hypothetical protein CSA74_11340 [Rhodobacterales bacterium]